MTEGHHCIVNVLFDYERQFYLFLGNNPELISNENADQTPPFKQ